MPMNLGLGLGLSRRGGGGPSLFRLILSGNTLTYSGRGLTLNGNTLRFI